MQLLEPIEFVDFQVQPVCIDPKCPSKQTKGIAIQFLNSIETTSYQKIESDYYCISKLSPKYNSALEICTSPCQSRKRCDPYPPQMIGHPLVSYENGYFVLRGVFSTSDTLPPNAPCDAAGYAATCKDNNWLHSVAFCGYSTYIKPPSWILGLYDARDILLDELPFFVAVKVAGGQGTTRGGNIIGPRHVITTSALTSGIEVAYGLTANDYPYDIDNLPASRKIAVIDTTHFGGFSLLTLAEEFPFFNDDGSLNKQVQPICLPPDCNLPGSQPQVGDIVQVAGLGLINGGQNAATVQTDNWTVNAVDADCMSEAASYPQVYNNGFYFCANSRACDYDWGGSVVSKLGDKYFLISIIYHIFWPCDTGLLVRTISYFSFLYVFDTVKNLPYAHICQYSSEIYNAMANS